MMPPEALEAASGTMLQLRAGHAEKEVTADDIVAASKSNAAAGTAAANTVFYDDGGKGRINTFN